MRRTTLIYWSKDKRKRIFYCATSDSFIHWVYEPNKDGTPWQPGGQRSYTESIGGAGAGSWLLSALLDGAGVIEPAEPGDFPFVGADPEFEQWFHVDQLHGGPPPAALKQKWRDRAIEREPAYME